MTHITAKHKEAKYCFTFKGTVQIPSFNIMVYFTVRVWDSYTRYSKVHFNNAHMYKNWWTVFLTIRMFGLMVKVVKIFETTEPLILRWSSHHLYNTLYVFYRWQFIFLIIWWRLPLFWLSERADIPGISCLSKQMTHHKYRFNVHMMNHKSTLSYLSSVCDFVSISEDYFLWLLLSFHYMSAYHMRSLQMEEGDKLELFHQSVPGLESRREFENPFSQRFSWTMLQESQVDSRKICYFAFKLN